MNGRLASRKFWISTFLLITAQVWLGYGRIGPQEWMWVCGLVGGGYLGMQGYIDGKRAEIQK